MQVQSLSRDGQVIMYSLIGFFTGFGSVLLISVAILFVLIFQQKFLCCYCLLCYRCTARGKAGGSHMSGQRGGGGRGVSAGVESPAVGGDGLGYLFNLGEQEEAEEAARARRKELKAGKRASAAAAKQTQENQNDEEQWSLLGIVIDTVMQVVVTPTRAVITKIVGPSQPETSENDKLSVASYKSKKSSARSSRTGSEKSKKKKKKRTSSLPDEDTKQKYASESKSEHKKSKDVDTSLTRKTTQHAKSPEQEPPREKGLAMLFAIGSSAPNPQEKPQTAEELAALERERVEDEKKRKAREESFRRKYA